MNKETAAKIHAESIFSPDFKEFATKGFIAGANWQAQQESEAIELLRDLRDLQNGPPLEQHRKEWEETMSRIDAFISKYESPR